MNNIIISEIEGNQAYDPCMADVRYEDTIGGRLFLARKTKGLTLQAVGAELQVRASHLSGVENNKVGVSLDLFRGLLDLYDVSADAILGRPQPPLDDHALGVTEEAEIVADLVDLMPRTKRMEVLDVIPSTSSTPGPPPGVFCCPAPHRAYSFAVKFMLDMHALACYTVIVSEKRH